MTEIWPVAVASKVQDQHPRCFSQVWEAALTALTRQLPNVIRDILCSHLRITKRSIRQGDIGNVVSAALVG